MDKPVKSTSKVTVSVTKADVKVGDNVGLSDGDIVGAEVVGLAVGETVGLMVGE